MQDNDNRRVHPRRPLALAARIYPSGDPCTIVDLTPRGMRLQLVRPMAMPDGFIVVEWESGDAHDAQAVWSDACDVGVQILRSCDLRDHTPHPFAAAKAAWLASNGDGCEVNGVFLQN